MKKIFLFIILLTSIKGFSQNRIRVDDKFNWIPDTPVYKSTVILGGTMIKDGFKITLSGTNNVCICLVGRVYLDSTYTLQRIPDSLTGSKQKH